jgi:hypothetical protein
VRFRFEEDPEFYRNLEAFLKNMVESGINKVTINLSSLLKLIEEI